MSSLPFYQGSSSTSPFTLLSTLLHFYLKGHIAVHHLQIVHWLVLINQLLPKQHTAFTPVSSLDLAFAHPLLQMSSVLPRCLCAWEHWPNHCLCWHPKWWMLFFSGFLFFTSSWLIFLHVPSPIQDIASLQPSYSLLCASSRQDWGPSCWASQQHSLQSR